jgi:peroxiredoxin
MKTQLVSAVALLALILITVCPAAQAVSVATIGYSDRLSIGDLAPGIPLIDSKGEQTSFAQIRQPVAIVTFVEAEDNALPLDPRVASLAKRFRYAHVSVAQIDLGDQPEQSTQTKLTNSKVMTLCDPERIVWNQYKQPEADSVFLINERGRIEATGTLGNLKRLIHRARALSREAERFHTDMMTSG